MAPRDIFEKNDMHSLHGLSRETLIQKKIIRRKKEREFIGRDFRGSFSKRSLSPEGVPVRKRDSFEIEGRLRVRWLAS